MTVGSATPSINNGWPPIIECMNPQVAVDAKVWTAVRTPSAEKNMVDHVPRIYIHTNIYIKDLKSYNTCISLKLFTKWNDRNCRSKENVSGGS